MQRSFSQSCLWAICLSILCTPILFAQSKQTTAQRWEYQTINCDTNELMKLGDVGWELVAVTTQGGGYCGSYLLKRPKPANAPKYIDPNERPKPPANAPTCNLGLAQAPTIRGLRLGMTVDELIELFPGVNPNELKLRAERAKEYSAFGQFEYSFPGTQHKDRLDNFNFNVALFDGRVRVFSIHYPFNNSTMYGRVYSQDAMIEKLAESFSLPSKESWKTWYNSPYLECQGFKLTTSIQNNTSITLEDSSQSYLEKIKQRQEEYSAKKKTEFKP